MAWSPAQSHDDFVSLAVSQPQSVVPRGPGYSLLGISCGKGAEARGGGVGSCRKKDMLVFGEAPVAGNDPKQFMLKGRQTSVSRTIQGQTSKFVFSVQTQPVYGLL